jgi:hypothetical protein
MSLRLRTCCFSARAAVRSHMSLDYVHKQQRKNDNENNTKWRQMATVALRNTTNGYSCTTYYVTRQMATVALRNTTNGYSCTTHLFLRARCRALSLPIPLVTVARRPLAFRCALTRTLICAFICALRRALTRTVGCTSLVNVSTFVVPADACRLLPLFAVAFRAPLLFRIAIAIAITITSRC